MIFLLYIPTKKLPMYKNCFNQIHFQNGNTKIMIMDRYFQATTHKTINMYQYPKVCVSSKEHYCKNSSGIELKITWGCDGSNVFFGTNQSELQCFINNKNNNNHIMQILENTNSVFHFKISHVRSESIIKRIEINQADGSNNYAFELPFILVCKTIHAWYKSNGSSIKFSHSKDIHSNPYCILVKHKNKKYIHFPRDSVMLFF